MSLVGQRFIPVPSNAVPVTMSPDGMWRIFGSSQVVDKNNVVGQVLVDGQGGFVPSGVIEKPLNSNSVISVIQPEVTLQTPDATESIAQKTTEIMATASSILPSDSNSDTASTSIMNRTTTSSSTRTSTPLPTRAAPANQSEMIMFSTFSLILAFAASLFL